jgi:hypothetical protein
MSQQQKYFDEVQKYASVVVSPLSKRKKRGASGDSSVIEIVDISGDKPESFVTLRAHDGRVFEKTLHWVRKNTSEISSDDA